MEKIPNSTPRSRRGRPDRNKKKKHPYQDIAGKFILIRVGNENHPANNNDLQSIQVEINKLFSDHNVDDCLVYVTHHAVDVSLVEGNKNKEIENI